MMTEHGTQCFRIIRTGGSGTDFSYPHCISQRPPSRKQEVAQALRRTVRFDLYKARDKFFATHSGSDGLVSCAVTGERIARKEAQMDHRPPARDPWKRSPLRAPRPLSLWRRLLRPPEWSLNVKRPRPVWRACVVLSPVLLFAPTGPPHASRDSGKGSGQTSCPVPAP